MSTTETERPALSLAAGEVITPILTSAIEKNEDGEYECPECAALHAENPEHPRTMAKSKGPLGKHRNREHGIIAPARGSKKNGVRKARAPKAEMPVFDSRKMLTYIFPNGIPADPHLMQDALDWVEQGRMLFDKTAKYRKS